MGIIRGVALCVISYGIALSLVQPAWGIFETTALYGTYGSYGLAGVNTTLLSSVRVMPLIPGPIGMPGQILDPPWRQLPSYLSAKMEKEWPRADSLHQRISARYGYPTLSTIPQMIGNISGWSGPMGMGYWGGPWQRFYYPDGVDNYAKSVGPGKPPYQPGQNSIVPLPAMSDTVGDKVYLKRIRSAEGPSGSRGAF